jgi:hypothetical protein
LCRAAKGGDRGLRLAGGDLRLAQALGQQRFVGQGGTAGRRQLERRRAGLRVQQQPDRPLPDPGVAGVQPHGALEQRLRGRQLAAAQLQAGQGQQGAAVVGRALQQRLEALLGEVGAVASEVELGQPRGGGEERSVDRQRTLEGCTRHLGLAPPQRDLAAQVLGQCDPGPLGGQPLDRLGRGVELAPGQVRADQGQVGALALRVTGRRGLQLAQTGLQLALDQVGPAQRGPDVGVARPQRQRACEVLLRGALLAGRQCGLAGQREAVDILAARPEQGLQRLQRALRAAGRQVHAGQLAAQIGGCRGQAQGLLEVQLGLRRRPERELDAAGQHRQVGLRRGAAQQRLQHFARALQVTTLARQQGLEVQGLGLARQGFLHGGQLRAGGRMVVPAHGQRDQPAVRRQQCRRGLQRPSVGLDRGLGLAARLRQVAPQGPASARCGVAGQHGVDRRTGGIEPAAGEIQAGAQQGGVDVATVAGERARQRLPCGVESARHGLGQREQGGGLRVVLLGQRTAQLTQDLVGLALGEQRRGQPQPRLRARHPAELDLGACRIAVVQQGAAKQQPGVDVLGPGLDQALEFDQGRSDFATVQARACLLERGRVGPRTPAGAHRQHHGRQPARGLRPGVPSHAIP